MIKTLSDIEDEYFQDLVSKYPVTISSNYFNNDLVSIYFNNVQEGY